MIRVYGLGDLKIAFYQNVLPSRRTRDQSKDRQEI
jgi:hypothetical protein